MSDVAEHKPEPTPWQTTETGRKQRLLICRFCEKPIQRRGLLRRWRHVA